MDALRHQDHAGEPGGRHLSGRGIHRQYGGSAGAQHAGVGVRGPVRRGPAHQPGGGPAGAAVRHHARRRSGGPARKRVQSADGADPWHGRRVRGGHCQGRGFVPDRASGEGGGPHRTGVGQRGQQTDLHGGRGGGVVGGHAAGGHGGGAGTGQGQRRV